MTCQMTTTQDPWFNLGLDQIGELHVAVERHLCEGETWILHKIRRDDDLMQFWVVGSRGTQLLASLLDEGWKIRAC